MLTYFRTTGAVLSAVALAAVTTLLATAVEAETYDILILDEGYFPDITYVAAGDTLVFYNESVIPHTVVAKNSSWATPELAPGQSISLEVTQGMQNTFGSVDINGFVMEAYLNFNGTPGN